MFRFLINQFVLMLANINELFALIFRSAFRGRNEEDEEGTPRAWYLRLLFFPFTLLRWIAVTFWTIITFPFGRIFRMSVASRQDLLWGLPALAMILAVIGMTAAAVASSRSISNRYRSKMFDAIEAKDYPKAKLLCSRLMSGVTEPDSETLLTFADLLGKTNETQRAEAIITKLAPDDAVGNQKAHRMRAVEIAGKTTNVSDPEILKKLRWHLQNSGSATPEINQIWSMYYLTVGQEELAIRHMELAAKANPQMLLTAADLNKHLGNVAGSNRALREAEAIFTKAIQLDPLNTQARVLLASALIRQEKFEAGEKVLLAGRSIQPDVLISRAIAECYLLQHDRAVTGNASIGEQLEQLQKALEADVNYLPIYERLIRQYRRQDDKTSKEIRTLLSGAIAGGESSPLAHFALSNVYMIDGQKDEADWHLQQAYRQDSKFAVIGNNLAWILAHRDPPELDQAFEIIKSVMVEAPGDARFRDTYATILMKQGKDDQAIIEFERALPGMTDRSTIHQSLAILYRKIGRASIADEHERLAVDAAKKLKK